MYTADNAREYSEEYHAERLNNWIYRLVKEAVEKEGKSSTFLRIEITDPLYPTIREELEKRGFTVTEVNVCGVDCDVDFSWERY